MEVLLPVPCSPQGWVWIINYLMILSVACWGLYIIRTLNAVFWWSIINVYMNVCWVGKWEADGLASLLLLWYWLLKYILGDQLTSEQPRHITVNTCPRSICASPRCPGDHQQISLVLHHFKVKGYTQLLHQSIDREAPEVAKMMCPYLCTHTDYSTSFIVILFWASVHRALVIWLSKRHV